MVLDSGYISSSPFMGLSLVHDYTAIGTTDGKVFIYLLLLIYSLIAYRLDSILYFQLDAVM